MERKLESELFDYMFERCEKMPGFKEASKAGAKGFRPLIVMGGESLVGIREKTGRNDGKYIELIQETVGGHGREPYCVGGAMTCIAFAEEVTGLKSPLIATELATAVWGNTPKELRVKGIPLPGALAIWQDVNTKTKKKKITGHLEIVRSAANTKWYGVGFNTSGASYPGGPVNREGNGVYYTTRDYADRAGRILLGFVKPI